MTSKIGCDGPRRQSLKVCDATACDGCDHLAKKARNSAPSQPVSVATTDPLRNVVASHSTHWGVRRCDGGGPSPPRHAHRRRL